MQLKNFDIDAFLKENWQQKPAFIKNPWKSWVNPMDADELAGLACEKDVEARLISGTGNEWQVEHGPLPEARFGSLGDKNWTLLVQAVDHYVPAVAELLEPFRFIPNWRIDDVMVSYAANGGGVGPHFDQYDVFLIQGAGKRRWEIGNICDENSELLPHDDLRLLQHFEAQDEYICEPGDIVYIPPGVAHNGVATGDDCMTYSIGFRAPSRSELLGYWVDDLLAEMSDDDRYSDPGLTRQSNCGEIAQKDIDRLHQMVTEKITDREAFANWFGQYSSTPKYPDMDWSPDEGVGIVELRSILSQGQQLTRNPASRFSYIEHATDRLSLFVDGTVFDCSADAANFARQLCAATTPPIRDDILKSEDIVSLLLQLISQGALRTDSSEE